MRSTALLSLALGLALPAVVCAQPEPAPAPQEQKQPAKSDQVELSGVVVVDDDDEVYLLCKLRRYQVVGPPAESLRDRHGEQVQVIGVAGKPFIAEIDGTREVVRQLQATAVLAASPVEERPREQWLDDWANDGWEDADEEQYGPGPEQITPRELPREPVYGEDEWSDDDLGGEPLGTLEDEQAEADEDPRTRGMTNILEQKRLDRVDVEPAIETGVWAGIKSRARAFARYVRERLAALRAPKVTTDITESMDPDSADTTSGGPYPRVNPDGTVTDLMD